ncbi:MAG: hypothetical protein JNM45_16730 [Rhizobiales bacterium]|nr:hypothetical protein [Hyphomicrobiales bacterium]
MKLDLVRKPDSSITRITLDRSDKSERVEINAHSLDASIDFPAQTPISYKVESKASWVDSALPNSGEGATVAIRSEHARVKIR